VSLIAQLSTFSEKLWARRDLLVALLSLFVAVYAVVQERRISRDLKQTTLFTKEISQNQAEISQNLTTTYIGEFPQFLRNIIAVIGSAHESVSVATNVPGYGLYTDHEKYLEYISALQKQLANGRKVKIVVLAEQAQAQFRKRQFQKLTIEELKNPQKTASNNFKAFLRWSDRTAENIPTMDAFRSALSAEQKSLWEHDFRGFNRALYDKPMPIYLWIVDGHLAIFAVPTFPVANEGAFLTKDERLIHQLQSVFDGYLADATPVSSKLTR